MQTDKITITSKGSGMEEAMEEAMKFAEYIGLDRKKTMRLRLLVEETLGMVEAITDDFAAYFWLESDEDKSYRIHLTAETYMDYNKKQGLLSITRDGKNDASKGFMGKIRNLIENSIYNMNEVGRLQAEYGGSPVMYGSMGMYDVDASSSLSTYAYMWSMDNYRQSIQNQMEEDKASKDAWDELEKSIVASIADDVRVGVKGNIVEMVIEKKNYGG